VQRADGSWLDVQPLPDALVVNTGDMMQRWTNDRWRSTVHRVINRRAGRDRWSIAYFFDLDADAVIEPLPTCVEPRRAPRGALRPPDERQANTLADDVPAHRPRGGKPPPAFPTRPLPTTP
jgi:isopenicillin N synthase-like dioxygenase